MERVFTSTAPSVPAPAPVERPMVFISHATSDRPVVERLAVALEAAGVRVWMASKDIAVGANYAQEITDALSRAAGIAVVLTPAAITSPHVRREVNLAIDRGRELLPIDLSASPEFMATLPGDWTYWLSLAQVLPYTDDKRTAAELARRLGVAG